MIYNYRVVKAKEIMIMDYRFSATDLQENDFIIVELPNNKSVCINLYFLLKY